ncbi:hypothetical protein LTR27_005599 [Elasticomyces elasticus]|nr:hypothetical protein LTR27_005599 [Elasticomyces elasticus]
MSKELRLDIYGILLEQFDATIDVVIADTVTKRMIDVTGDRRTCLALLHTYKKMNNEATSLYYEWLLSNFTVWSPAPNQVDNRIRGLLALLPSTVRPSIEEIKLHIEEDATPSLISPIVESMMDLECDEIEVTISPKLKAVRGPSTTTSNAPGFKRSPGLASYYTASPPRGWNTVVVKTSLGERNAAKKTGEDAC